MPKVVRVERTETGLTPRGGGSTSAGPARTYTARRGRVIRAARTRPDRQVCTSSLGNARASADAAMPSGCCPISSATRLDKAAGLVVLRRPAALGQHQFNESVAVGLDDVLGYRLSATGAAGLFGLGKLFVSAHVGPSPRVAVVLLSVVVSALARTRRSSSTSSGGGVALGPRMYLVFPSSATSWHREMV